MRVRTFLHGNYDLAGKKIALITIWQADLYLFTTDALKCSVNLQ